MLEIIIQVYYSSINNKAQKRDIKNKGSGTGKSVGFGENTWTTINQCHT